MGVAGDTRYDRSVLAVPPQGLTPAEFAKWIVREVMINLRVGMPAEVVSWSAPVAAGASNSTPALVKVQPHFIFSVAINSPDELTDEERAKGWTLLQEQDGYLKQKALPQISNVPVHYPGTAGMLVRGPLKAGEVGWIKFADRSIDKWTKRGGPVDPGFDSHYHQLSDAIFEPGLRYGRVSPSIPTDKHVIGPETGSAGLEFDDVEGGALPNARLYTTGDELTIDAAQLIKIGEAATVAQDAIRRGDPVNPGAAMSAWALVVETFANSQVPGTFTPANSFATTVATPANSGRFGACGTGSQLVKIEG